MRTNRAVGTVVLTALLTMGGIAASSASAETTATQGVTAVGGRLANGAGPTSGKCMEISGSGTTNAIQMGTCHRNAHAGWTFEPVVSDRFEIRSHDKDAAGKCLTGSAYGEQAYMSICDDLSSQQWTQIPAPGDWFMLRNNYSARCLDVKGHGTTNIVQTFPCGDPATAGPQKWKWRSV